MKSKSVFFSGCIVGLTAGSLVFAVWELVNSGKTAIDTKKPQAPAKVDRVVSEAEFNKVTLTPQAAKRLGIETALVTKAQVPRFRPMGSEVVLPPGQVVQIAAPLAGVIKQPKVGDLPMAGTVLKAGQPVLLFAPILTPDAKVTMATARIEAEGQVKNAETQTKAAKIALDRAVTLLKADAGSKRTVDEAQEKYDLALKSLEAVQARSMLLQQILDSAESGTVAGLPITSPFDGILRNLTVHIGQTVPSGAALFEVMDTKRVWLRVPAYAGELANLDTTAGVRIAELSAKPNFLKQLAQPVAAPPSANPIAATVDLHYQIDNRDGTLHPGQRITAFVPERSEGESLIVPWSAVILDIHGGEWVYEQTAPETFVRRRVQVRLVVDDRAILATGPPSGTAVVVRGAVELYSVEVGFSK